MNDSQDREPKTTEVLPGEKVKHAPLGRRVARVFQTVAMLCVLGLFALVAIKYSPFNPDQVPVGANHPGVGRELEVLSLTPLTGEVNALNRESVLGRVTLINFWGTWCPPCRAEFPELVAVARKFRNEPQFHFLSVSCGPPDEEDDLETLRESTEAFIAQHPSDFPIYADPGLITRKEVNRVAGFSAYPTTILLDQDCIIRAVWQGYWRGLDHEIEQAIREVLTKNRPSGPVDN